MIRIYLLSGYIEIPLSYEANIMNVFISQNPEDIQRSMDECRLSYENDEEFPTLQGVPTSFSENLIRIFEFPANFSRAFSFVKKVNKQSKNERFCILRILRSF